MERGSDRAGGAPERGDAARKNPQRLPAGFRWIAVRPGAAPPPRRRPRNFGPTPRYAVIPRWGLVDHFETVSDEQQAEPRRGPWIGALRATLIATIAVLGVAALVHMIRYALLIINRDVLLNPVVAWLATWLGIVVSVAALFLVFATFVLLTNWLIARRAAAFKHVGLEEHRPLWALRAGCLVPFVNLAWAPVYVLELASVEERHDPAAPSHHRLVGAVGAVRRWCPCSPSRPASPPTPRASPTTPLRRSSPT